MRSLAGVPRQAQGQISLDAGREVGSNGGGYKYVVELVRKERRNPLHNVSADTVDAKARADALAALQALARIKSVL